MLRIFASALNEMFFNIFEQKLLLEIIDNKVDVDTVLARIHIGGDKSALRERVDADMAFGNHENTAPAARVLNMIIGSRMDLHMRLTERAHPKRIAKSRETREDRLVVVEPVMVAPVSVYGYMFAEMGRHT